MEKILGRITPKKILLLWSFCFITSIIFTFVTTWPLSDTFSALNHIGLFFLFLLLTNLNIYSLRSCSIYPGFSPYEYSPVLYPCPAIIIISIVFIAALINEKKQRKELETGWWLALIYTVLMALVASAELFNYFCYPLPYFRLN